MEENIKNKVNMTNWIYANEFVMLFLIFIYYRYLLFINIKAWKSLFAIIPFLAIWTLYLIKEIFKDISVRLILTEDRIIGKKGLIKTKVIDIPFENIDNVQITYNLIGKILRYGNIYIESKSEVYEFKKISNPFRLKKEIISKMLKNTKN